MLTPIAWIALVVAAACALVILGDMIVLGYRQPMPIMEIVWPVTALYLGPFAVLGYWRWGRPKSRRWHELRGEPPERPFPAVVGVAVSHCGAGCTIGDIIGSTLVFLLALEVAGLALWAELPIDFVLAFALGILFQYRTIAPMRGLGLREGLVAALKADTLSLTAFEVGLFGWMILVQLGLFAPEGIHADDPIFWFMMQIGMALGFLTAYPVNWWLVRVGLKERM